MNKRRFIEDGTIAGLIASLPSGIPSTAHAVVTGGDPLEAARAAGSIALPDDASSAALLVAAAPIHLSISIAWGIALAAALPRRRTTMWGAAAGAVIAAVDLGAAGRWWPRIRALPQAAQVADHLAFGAVVGFILAQRRDARDGAEEDRE